MLCYLFEYEHTKKSSFETQNSPLVISLNFIILLTPMGVLAHRLQSLDCLLVPPLA